MCIRDRIKMEGKIQSNDKYLIKTKYPENYSADGVQRACIEIGRAHV